MIPRDAQVYFLMSLENIGIDSGCHDLVENEETARFCLSNADMALFALLHGAAEGLDRLRG